MSGFRGSDETLDQEIETLTSLARLRLRRYSKDLKDLDKDLRELRAERARRRARALVPEYLPESAGYESSSEP